MSGWMGYALGYENGRSDAERSREQRELIQRVMYGHRIVEVDQSYIDNLRQLFTNSAQIRPQSTTRPTNSTAKLLSGKPTLSTTRPARQPCRRK